MTTQTTLRKAAINNKALNAEGVTGRVILEGSKASILIFEECAAATQYADGMNSLHHVILGDNDGENPGEYWVTNWRTAITLQEMGYERLRY